MIVLDLLCNNGHRFDGWFSSVESFRDQQAKDLVQCALCHTSAIKQLPSAPHVRRAGRAVTAEGSRQEKSSEVAAVSRPNGATEHQAKIPLAANDGDPQAVKSLFNALATMARQAEDVGDRLPEEARRIHYDEAPARNIRGVATRDETRELLEEGILVLPAPVPPENETH